MELKSKSLVQERFGAFATTYATSRPHAKGNSLLRLVELVAPRQTWIALDIAVASVQSNAVVIFVNDGKGKFRQGFRITPGDEPVAVTAADVNADGKLDLVIGARADHVYVYLGQGDGTFTLSGVGITGAGPHPIAVGDVNQLEPGDRSQ